MSFLLHGVGNIQRRSPPVPSAIAVAIALFCAACGGQTKSSTAKGGEDETQAKVKELEKQNADLSKSLQSMKNSVAEAEALKAKNAELASDRDAQKSAAERHEAQAKELEEANKELTKKHDELLAEYEELKNAGGSNAGSGAARMSSDLETQLLIELDDALKPFAYDTQGDCLRVSHVEESRQTALEVVSKLETELIRIFSEYVAAGGDAEQGAPANFKERGEKLVELRNILEISAALKQKVCDFTPPQVPLGSAIDIANTTQKDILKDQATLLGKFTDADQLLGSLKNYLKDLQGFMAALANAITNGNIIVLPAGAQMTMPAGFHILDLGTIQKSIDEIQKLIQRIEADKRKGKVKPVAEYLKSIRALPDISSYTKTISDQPTTYLRPTKQIELTDEDKAAGDVAPGEGGLSSDEKTGDVVVLKDRNEILTRSQQLGLNPEAVEDAIRMKEATGGIIYLAHTDAEVGDAIATKLLGNIKTSMNTHGETNLELVFAIDYSGSMKENIQSVCDNLSKITKSLEAIKKLGTVKLAIAIFHHDASIELGFTENFSEIQSKLQVLLKQYDPGAGTGPGEMSILALEKIGNLAWSSKPGTARKVLLVTDEPSNEMRTFQEKLVKSVLNQFKSKKIAIHPVVVPE